MILDRSTAPEFQIPKEISFPTPVIRTLSNGVPIYFIPTPEIDAIKLEISAVAGLPDENFDKKLVPSFTLQMVMEGTKTKNAAELDDFFDTYATEVEPQLGFEHQGLSILTTKKHFKTVLPVFRDLLTEAVFPEKELVKRKKQKALSISIHKEQNGHRASSLFRKALFGENHLYGQIAEESDVDMFSREDLEEYYHKELWTNPEIFLTGNIEEDEMNIIIEAFENLPVRHTQLSDPEAFNIPSHKIREEKEKSVQSSIRIGCHMIPKTHPDYHYLLIFNTILGGYFGCRLIKNIREDKGYTYGISSSLGGLKTADYWAVMADVIKEFSDKVIEEVYLEIQKLQQEPVPSDEMETVRNYMVGKLLTQFSSGFDLIGRFKSIHQAGLDFSFYQAQLELILSFNQEDIMAVGNKYFKEENMVEVIVG
ncbi:M16 family metallopeptidase [Aquiflexum sp.]|uniref:M16 family metallopeptidase n=1 Tax=Aquiflexum sp. TaxID=1872584 RepID=UPI0035933BAE